MNYSSFSLNRLLQALVFFLALASPAFAEYQTGIDITLSGTAGNDYAIETFYHDPIVNDRKVVYIKAATSIAFSHNARNVIQPTSSTAISTYTVIGANGGNGLPNAGPEGVIRYRVDGDLHWGPQWTSGGGRTNVNPAYSNPLSFATLTYPTGAGGGLSVLGRTGNNGAAITSKATYFTYGIADSVGDEWHTITVADDDYAFSVADTEWRASDGRVFHFVVNPKTPCLSVAVTGNGQFYTTPPKNYFIPKIHDQTTYIQPGTGSVSITLRDINGNNVFYRIGSGSFINAGSSSVTLADSAFATGTNTLQYYYAGNVAYTKTRAVVKNPAFPSAGESHGFLQFGNAANYTAMLARLAVDPYVYWYNRSKSGGREGRSEWASFGNRGYRTKGENAFANALLAKIEGVNANEGGPTFAQYAKEMTLQSLRNIDNVGFEMPHTQNTLPSRELTSRGYNDVVAPLSVAYAYDLLISFYRTDLGHTNGFTPIEDYFARDLIANDIVECLMFTGGFQGDSVGVAGQFTGGGMWDTARKCGALVGMFAIPKYSTNYYGTNGLDGNTTVYPWTPYRDAPLTWKKIFLDEDAPKPGYPNATQTYPLGIENVMISADGVFQDKVDYASNMSPAFYHAANVLKFHYPSKALPGLENFFLKVANGTAYGTKARNDGTMGPAQVINLCTYNAKFPTVAEYGVPFVTALESSNPQSDNQAGNGSLPYLYAWYDINYGSGSTPPTVRPSNARVNMTASP